MRKLGVAIAIALVLAFGFTGTAEAKVTADRPSVSLPYVEDVNPQGSGYVATVSCAGSPSDIRVTCKGKRVKVHRESKRVWTVKLKKNAYYKLSVRAAGGKWKSIGYRVY